MRHVTSNRMIAVRGRELEVRDDLVVGEEPLEIRAAGPRREPIAIAVTMRTPGHEDELAVGFLTTEGLLDDNTVTAIRYGDPGDMAEPDDVVLVRTAKPFDPAIAKQRHFVATASCGICGKASIDEIAVRSDPLPAGRPVVSRQVIVSLPDRLREAQAAFDVTGGVHAAGLFDAAGQLVEVREDVGRHNALDKVVGFAFRTGLLPLADEVLCVSGRLSFELVQKAALAGCPVLVGVGAPSSLAVRLAEAQGVTLCGWARRDRVSVYANGARVGN